MASPANLFGPTPESLRNKANWLGRYLAVQKGFDVELAQILSDAAQDTTKRFEKLTDAKQLSKKLRRAQLALAQRQIKKDLNERFGQIGGVIRNSQQDAAVAAVNASLFDQRGILARLFKSPSDRKQYAESLEQTARRNVEAVMTRTLSSAKPLSTRVYKTKALSNGLVDRAINRGLSRGDSAIDIANSVKSLIRPDVPGGISYAARRLGRTEINNAFHAQSIFDAEDTPWINQMEWHLSKVHKNDEDDPCEDYALERYFPMGHVPEKPHPNCLCYVTPVVEDYDIFERNLLAGQYDSYIEDKMGVPASKIIGNTGIEPSDKPIEPTISAVVPGAKDIPQNWYDAKDLDQLTRGFQSRWYTPELGNIELTNWTPENISVDTAREILRATDDLMVKYPQSQGTIGQLVIRPAPRRSEYARTIRTANGTNVIAFNQSWTRDSASFERAIKKNVADGFHPPNTDIEPWRDMLTHEFGHVLDNIGDTRARINVDKLIINIYKEKNPPTFDFEHMKLSRGQVVSASPQLFRKEPKNERDKWWNDLGKWLRGSNTEKYNGAAPSKYGLNYWQKGDDYTLINPQESLAEAFLDVERNGDKAKPLSKALYDSLVEGSKKNLSPRPLLHLDETASSPSATGLVRGDYVPNPVEIKDFIDVPDDKGRWTYREIFHPKNTENNHDFIIEPKTYPAVKEQVINDKTFRIFYDPDETSLETTDFGIKPTVKNLRITDYIDPPKEKLIWRGMSAEEYENALRTGYFESTGVGNIGDAQVGVTFFSDDIKQAASYATDFAFPEFRPTFDKPGYVVGIIDRPEIIRDGTEVGIKGRISTDSIQKVYVAKPYAITPGEMGVQKDWNDIWSAGGSFQPNVYTKWSEVVVPQQKSDVDAIMDLLGGPVKDKPRDIIPKVIEPPIEGVPRGQETYVKHLLSLEDTTQEATVYMPVSELKRYREYDRAAMAASKDQLDAIEYVVKKEGGIKNPLLLSTDGETALLHEGNHRLVVAERLGIKELPVKITLDKEVIRNEGLKPATLDDNLKTFVQERLSKHDYETGPEVYWTGPEVSDYLGSDELNDVMEKAWTSMEFDYSKDDFRRGAREVELKGYKGITDKELYDPEFGIFNSIYDETGEENSNPFIYGKEIVAQAITEEPNWDSLYRGVRLLEKDSNFVAGQEVSLPLSSFTDLKSQAEDFANGVGWVSKDAKLGERKPVILELLPGSKTTPLGGENIAFGRFKVVGVKQDGDLKHVVLQQISMLEDIPKALKAKTAIIPEMTIIDPIKDEVTEVLAPSIVGGTKKEQAVAKAIERIRDKTLFMVRGDLEITDPRGLNDLAHGVEKMSKKYPDVNIAGITIDDDMDLSTDGQTVPYYPNEEFDAIEKRVSSGIYLNRDTFLNYDYAKTLHSRDIGFHPPGEEKNPMFSTYLHEFGHAIQNEFYQDPITDSEVEIELRSYFTNNKWPAIAKELEERKGFQRIDKLKAARISNEKAWRDQLSGYSFYRGGKKFINASEALAEAFDAVERLGKSAAEPYQVLYNLLMRRYKERVKP